MELERGLVDEEQVLPEEEQLPESDEDQDEEPEPEREAQKTAGPGAYLCPDCGRHFESQRGLSRHITDIHGRPSANSSRQRRAPGATRRAQGPQAPPRRRSSSVQMGMFLAYRLAGAAFATFGPEPVMTRQLVGASMTMTAGPAAAGLDRVARRTPFYGLLDTLFSGAGIIEDLTPLGVPLFVGMYGYASRAARERMRPMIQEGLTVLLAQMYKVEMPVEQAATEATMGIELTPDGMRQMAEGLIQTLDMAQPEPDHAAAAA